jgi:hypothetical protein
VPPEHRVGLAVHVQGCDTVHRVDGLDVVPASRPVHQTLLTLSCGDAGRVGKTSLVLRYVQNTFNDAQPATIQASYLTKRLTVENKTINLAIWVRGPRPLRRCDVCVSLLGRTGRTDVVCPYILPTPSRQHILLHQLALSPLVCEPCPVTHTGWMARARRPLSLPWALRRADSEASHSPRGSCWQSRVQPRRTLAHPAGRLSSCRPELPPMDWVEEASRLWTWRANTCG